MFNQPLNAVAEIIFIFLYLRKIKKFYSLQVPPCACGSQEDRDRPGSMACVVFTETAD